MKQGFTIFETLIAITVGVTLLGLVLSIYVLSIRSLNSGQDRSELTQDSRVITERITRDIRETRGIATVLPPDPNDVSNPPPNDIELQDGHTSTLQYIRYYLSGTDLKRQIRQYYFAAEPAIMVPFDAEDDFSNPPSLTIVSDTLVGQFVNDIDYYGENPIYFELILKEGSITHTTKTAIYGRNL
jgi:Tfp pilus assembly protein PilW